MNQQLLHNGFCKNYFPFNKIDIETLKLIAEKATKLERNQRKNIFKEFDEVRTLFQRAIENSELSLEHRCVKSYCWFTYW